MDCSWQCSRTATRLRFLQHFDAKDVPIIIRVHGLEAVSTEPASALMAASTASSEMQRIFDVFIFTPVKGCCL